MESSFRVKEKMIWFGLYIFFKMLSIIIWKNVIYMYLIGKYFVCILDIFLIGYFSLWLFFYIFYYFFKEMYVFI